MKSDQPLLSICIPTYNRSHYLERALCSIINNGDFDERTEIIISDNCSTDETEHIVKKYISNFSNIHYHRNLINIKDRNFFVALEHGSGRYLKLMNDTAQLKEGRLRMMLDIIKKTSQDRLLLFYNNEFSFHSDEIIHANSVSDFLASTSFYMTWIANFGIWANFLSKIEDPYKYSNLMLVQVDWQLQLILKVSCIDIVWGDFIIAEDIEGKGGYNIFNVFVDNYLFLLRKYLPGYKWSIEIEKYNLLKRLILPWVNTLIWEKNKKFSFDVTGYKSILFREYWYTPYFYFFVLKYYLAFLLRK